MTRAIVVVGGGGFGRETLDVVEAINRAAEAPIWRIAGVVDDSPSARVLERLAERGIEYLGRLAELTDSLTPGAFVVGVGSPQIRASIATRFEQAGWEAAALVHPAATVGSMVQVGPGSVVCGGAQLSTNTRLGRHVHVNPGAIIGHDSRLGEYVSVNPGAVISGEVYVEHSALIGAGAVVLQGLRVGSASTVGAAACVTRDVQASTVVTGVPARAHISRASQDER